MASRQQQRVEGRSCNVCTLCCKLIGVASLKKPSMISCEYCRTGFGCAIYSDRPTECAQFYCEYLLRSELDENWNPARAKMMVAFRQAVNSIAIYVDDAEPEKWREEPYYTQIKGWARTIYANRGQVIVWTGNGATAIMPGREKYLGPVKPAQKIVILSKKTPTATIYDAILVD